MDRRLFNLSALAATVLVAVSLHVHSASTQCGPDATTLINGKVMPVMAAVESSASTRAADNPVAAKSAVRAEKKSSADLAKVSNPATAGGGAGGGDDGILGNDGSASPGAHKRGLRWQSFLPGVIR